MADHKVSTFIARAQRRLEKNSLLHEASQEAMPWLAAGNIPEALNILAEYAPRVERLMHQQEIYADTTGGTE